MTGYLTKNLNEETGSCNIHQTGSLKKNAQDSETGLQANPQHNDQVEDEELVFVDKSETQTHQPKLRLQKGRLKRSRYTEVRRILLSLIAVSWHYCALWYSR